MLRARYAEGQEIMQYGVNYYAFKSQISTYQDLYATNKAKQSLKQHAFSVSVRCT